MCHIKCHMCHIKMSHVSHQSRRLLRLTSLTPSAFHQVSHVKIPIHYKLHTDEQFTQCYVTESVTKITRKRTIALFCVPQQIIQCIGLHFAMCFFAFLCVLHFALCFFRFSLCFALCTVFFAFLCVLRFALCDLI